MKLQRALSEISHIREQVARTETFRGYRSLTVGFSGFVALAAAGLQWMIVPRPAEQLGHYLAVWVSAAALSILVAGGEMGLRARRSTSLLAREHTAAAIEQFLPCLLAGAVLTVLVARYVPEARGMLPGLWSLLFSLGIFASVRLLPRPIFLVGAYYFLCGAVLLSRSTSTGALAPWKMGLVFGIGQIGFAAALYVTLERRRNE